MLIDIQTELQQILNQLPRLNITGQELLFSLGVALGLAAVIVTLVVMIMPLVIRAFEKTNNKIVAQRRKELMMRSLPDILNADKKERKQTLGWYDQWVDEAGPRLSKAEIKVSAARYVMIMLIIASIGAMIGLFVLKNLAAAVLLSFAAVLIPDQVLFRRIEKRRNELTAQLAVASRMLSAEFSDKPSVQQALSAVAVQLQDPLRSIFKRTADDLSAGLGPNIAFSRMLKELDFDVGHEFVQVLRVAYHDIAVRPMFSKLAVKIGGAQRLQQDNKNTLLWMKSMGLLLNILVIPTYIFMSLIIPETNQYLTESIIGRFIVTMIFLSVLLGILMDRALQRIDM